MSHKILALFCSQSSYFSCQADYGHALYCSWSVYFFMDLILPVSSPEFSGCYNLNSFACFFLVTAILRKVLISLSVLIKAPVWWSSLVVMSRNYLRQVLFSVAQPSLGQNLWCLVSFCNFNTSVFFLLLQNWLFMFSGVVELLKCFVQNSIHSKIIVPNRKPI